MGAQYHRQLFQFLNARHTSHLRSPPLTVKLFFCCNARKMYIKDKLVKIPYMLLSYQN